MKRDITHKKSRPRCQQGRPASERRIETVVMKHDITQTFEKSTALRKMADVCRSLEAMDVPVLCADLDHNGEMFILVYGYKPLWAWAKLHELPMLTEPWNYGDRYTHQTTAALDGVIVGALMDENDVKEAGI